MADASDETAEVTAHLDPGQVVEEAAVKAVAEGTGMPYTPVEDVLGVTA